MILDLSKSGLEMFGFEPYKVDVLRTVWTGGRTCSRDLYNSLKEKGFMISRASIINFLRRMAREGVFLEEAEGGVQTRHWYTPSPDIPNETIYLRRKLDYIYDRLNEEFMGCT